MKQWMTKTEYLFGHKKEHYYGVEFPQFAYDRIEDAKNVKRKLIPRILHYPQQQCKFQAWLRMRVAKIDDAINVWEKILEQEG